MQLKIHGDNIIECERALKLISLAYNATTKRKTNNLYFPTFEIISNENVIFEVDLLAGHGRWNVGIADILAKFGAPIREATDAYITKVIDDDQTEQIILAIEFCSALPAGNNAWQRNGRAITCAEIGIPYLYFAEVGGVELNKFRKVKAPRFPNPIVPFSYLTATHSLDTICLPVYEPHSAISAVLREQFADAFGLEDSLKLIKAIISQEESIAEPLKALTDRGTALVEILANGRKRVDTLRGGEWEAFRQLETGISKAGFLENDLAEAFWEKKNSEKVVATLTFRRLIAAVQNLNCLSVGAKGIPICLVPSSKINDLIGIFEEIYTAELVSDFVSRLDKEKPLLIVWISGFKPGGEDSRPDRGLVPLARMLFNNDIDLISIVSGPAKPGMWKLFTEKLSSLIISNGLWQAIYNLSDFIFVDSATSKSGILFSVTDRNLERKREIVTFTSSKVPRGFSEHDTDTAIHQIFSRREELGIFESMCNPPGGDWSGVSVLINETEYRWTSLARVSAISGKRPDHVIQFLADEPIFLAIESKNKATDLEDKIGSRLVDYVKDLFTYAPTAIKRKDSNSELSTETETPLNKHQVYSGGAFCYRNAAELSTEMEKDDLNFVMAFEFSNDGITTLHVKLSEQCEFLSGIFFKIAEQFVGGLKIQIH